MYPDISISTLPRGGYTVRVINPDHGSYYPYIVAFSTRSELLFWLGINLVSRSPELDPEAPAEDNPKGNDEIPF